MADIPGNITSKAVLKGFATLGSFSGVLEKPGDVDFIKVELFGGTTYNFYLQVLDRGSVTSGDAFLALHNADGTIAASNNDISIDSQNSFIQFTPGADGIFFLDVSGSVIQAGSYTLFSAVTAGTSNKLLTDNNDDYTGLAAERILAGKGADVIRLGDGFDALGEQGNDIITGNTFSNFISGGLGDDTMDGVTGADTMFGDAGNDVMFGGDDNDVLRGGIGNDLLDGGAQQDDLHGGGGTDFLTGGAGLDAFIFDTRADSTRGAGRDVIIDFEHATDKIDVSAIDAKTGGGNNTFKFIGAKAFHHKAGELHFVNKAGFQLVEGDVNGDGKADFQIELTGAHVLNAGDFVL